MSADHQGVVEAAVQGSSGTIVGLSGAVVTFQALRTFLKFFVRRRCSNCKAPSMSKKPEATEALNQNQITDRLISTKELAGYLSVHRTTISKWIIDGTVPPPIRLGNRNRWRLSEVNECLERLRAPVQF